MSRLFIKTNDEHLIAVDHIVSVDYSGISDLRLVVVDANVGNTQRTPLDECGHVYKDLDTVLDVLVQQGIAKIEHRLWPVANIKGTD